MSGALELHAYQKRGVEHLHANPRAALFLDMGLGKTATVLTALTPDHLPALVLAPKRVAEHVWPTETAKWRSDLSVEIAAGGRTHRRGVLAEAIEGRGADITVLGHDNTDDLAAVRPRAARPWRTLIYDESSAVKNRSTKRWKNVARYVKADDGPAHVWLLTGTPSPNGLADLWAQIWLLDQGERLERTLTSYRERYFNAGRRINGTIVDYKLKPGASTRIYEKIEDICLSMSAEDYLELPPATHNVIEVDLPPKSRKAFNELKANHVTKIDGHSFSAFNAAVLGNRLTQISAGFLYHHDDDEMVDAALQGREKRDVTGESAWLHDAKVEAVKEVVDGTGDGGVLVFYRYQAEADRMLAKIDGARHINEPDAIEDWDAGRIKVLLAHPASAGHGLNLQHGGHTIVWTTLPWSLEQWQQANKRLIRQGQTKPVVIHRLIAADTHDSVVYRALVGKASVQDALLAYLSPDDAPNARASGYSDDSPLDLDDILDGGDGNERMSVEQAIKDLV